eukprot:TRINITY_DN203_c1_g3_i1.p1 TRINITY_DN203_c1_g3~~TRINITY_DN203_c1_g3_i1.p1  ORF type:complete len:1098 (-),score=231.24 TRINITY_DN203_c1_g3_i1:964-4257(-)
MAESSSSSVWAPSGSSGSGSSGVAAATVPRNLLALLVPNLFLFVVLLTAAAWRTQVHFYRPLHRDADEKARDSAELSRAQRLRRGTVSRLDPRNYLRGGKKCAKLSARRAFHISVVLFVLSRVVWAILKLAFVHRKDPAAEGSVYFMDRLAHCLWQTSFLMVLTYIFTKMTNVGKKKKLVMTIFFWICNIVVYTFIIVAAVVIAAQGDITQKNPLYLSTVIVAIVYSTICAVAFIMLAVFLIYLVHKAKKSQGLTLKNKHLLFVEFVLFMCAFCFVIAYVFFLVAPEAHAGSSILYMMQVWVSEVPSTLVLLILMRKPQREVTASKEQGGIHEKTHLLTLCHDLVYSRSTSDPESLQRIAEAQSAALEAGMANKEDNDAAVHVPSAIMKAPPPEARALLVTLHRNTVQNALVVLYDEDEEGSPEISRTEVYYGVRDSITFSTLLLACDTGKDMHLRAAIFNVKAESSLEGSSVGSVAFTIDSSADKGAPLVTDAAVQERASRARLSISVLRRVTLDRRCKEGGSCYRAFLFNCGNDEGIFCVEELFESRNTFSLPYCMLKQILPLRNLEMKSILQFYDQMSVTTEFTRHNDMFSDVVHGLEQAKQRETLVNKMESAALLYTQHVAGIQHAVDQNGVPLPFTFKASTRKGDPDLRFYPINLHLQQMSVAPPDDNGDVPAYSRYLTATFGAPSGEHILKNKLGVYQLTRQLCALSSQDRKSLPPNEAKLLDIQLEDTRVTLQIRTDIALCHVVCAVADSFLAEARRHAFAGNTSFFQQVAACGYFLQFESLLSTTGGEAGMLGDYAGVAELLCSSFKLKLKRAPPREDGECRVLNVVCYPETSTPRWELLVELPACAAVDSIFGESSTVVTTLCAVLFTMGINEQQTMANALGECELQELINQASAQRVLEYATSLVKWAQQPDGAAVVLPPASMCCASSMASPTPLRASKLPSTSPTLSPTALLEHAKRCGQEAKQLQSMVHNSHKEKNITILAAAGDLTRAMQGGRVVSCKSAKDRTSMSVTWEQARILERNHNLQGGEQGVLGVANVMRCAGVRRANAQKNVGADKYAFNALQLKMLPEIFRAPKGTGGGFRSAQT